LILTQLTQNEYVSNVLSCCLYVNNDTNPESSNMIQEITAGILLKDIMEML